MVYEGVSVRKVGVALTLDGLVEALLGHVLHLKDSVTLLSGLSLQERVYSMPALFVRRL